jgi:hypothetical protein
MQKIAFLHHEIKERHHENYLTEPLITAILRAGIHWQKGSQGGVMMGDFNRYVDLFKTYGLEYIIIIVFLIAVIFFWRYLSKRPKKKGKKR